MINKYLPIVDEQILFGYTTEQMFWSTENEAVIWAYFIDKELLYSTQQDLNNRFLEPAPFSKFFTDQDQLSPGRIGVWIGFNIIKSYMENNDVSLQNLLQIEASEIFEKSKYKPKK
ncbi:MAG: hypothetical protein HC798_04445 [Polaribacter sp.]|nr:hypothetical protein [Polaribacter sp.]